MFAAIKKTATTATAIAVIAMIGVSTVPASAAGPRGDNQWRQDRHNAQQHRRADQRQGRRAHRQDRRQDYRQAHRRNKRNNNTEAAIVGGLIGLGAALIIGSALARPSQTRVTAARATSPRPWSNDWYAYCGSKYRSFNPRTGYFVTHSGDYRFCR